MERKQVSTSREHILSLANTSPLQAIEELIWNGLDAGARSVTVILHFTSLGILEAIEVRDDGHGLARAELPQAFGEIGNSRKAKVRTTADGRALHGREGKGRLKAFTLSNTPRWVTTHQTSGPAQQYEIELDCATPDYYVVSSSVTTSAATGTIVQLRPAKEGLAFLGKHAAEETLTRHFALYLSEYPNVSINYNGSRLQVESLIAHKERYELVTEVDRPPASVIIIEWKIKLDSRKLYLCDATGFSRHELPLKLHAPGIDFTAYLCTDETKEWADRGLLAMAEMSESIQGLVELAKEAIKQHVRKRLSLSAQDIVTEWKQEQVYPYGDDEILSPVVEAERQVFDVVAVHVHSLHPTFRNADNDTKKLTLALIRRALESNPSSLTTLLKGFVELPEDEQAELADLLQRTTLSSLIKAGKIVVQRLDIIRTFEHILFNHDWKERLLERTQLHRLLARELWILGEEYSISTDDESLKVVLHKHRKLLGLEELAPDVDVSLIDGREGIPDLVLWDRRKLDRSKFEHLVIELKRPRDPLGVDEITQIEKYAFTVSKDEHFNTDRVSWKFVLLGNDLDEHAHQRATNDNLPEGCIHRKGNVSIWVCRWADVLADAKARYEFFREKLDFEASADEGLKNLTARFPHLMVGRGVRRQKDLQFTAAAGE